jgi:drug/metabolite transporter (DMT)-like permease/cell division septum initiation protein DivIVA
MGRFEKRPDNPRMRGDLSRAAEIALWDVVEDLQNLKQNVLTALQEDVQRLQAEKTRLADDVQRLQDEKEHLQQARQITEQQALVRQLAQVLANHISSQLQASLANLANQTIERGSYPGAALSPAESTNNSLSEFNQNAEKLLGTLDDTLTVTFTALQQDLNNYQSNLSQQLSRMQGEQQQGEAILAALVNRLYRELEKTTGGPPRIGGTPTTLQVPQQKVIQQVVPEVASEVTPEVKPEVKSEVKSEVTLGGTPTKLQVVEEEVTPLVVEPTKPEPQSVLDPLLQLEELEERISSGAIPPMSLPQEEPPVVNSFSPRNLSQGETPFTPPLVPHADSSPATPPPTPPPAPVRELHRAVPPTPPPPPTPEQRATTPQPQQPRKSGAFSPLQIGLLLVATSTVVSAFYNVAIKVIFQESSQIFGVFDVERLILPTLGNSLLILMLRMLVVVPLMLVLAPIMHPRIWQDLQSLLDSVRPNTTSGNAGSKRIFWLSIASGGFLFLSQLLIYLSIGQVATGMAIALFFIYPLISGLLSWFLFRDRPTVFGLGAYGSICAGELLLLAGTANTDAGMSFGSTTGIASGVSFAIYVILTRICAAKLHPVTFTLINFATMLLFCIISLMVPLPGDLSLQLDPTKLLELVLSAFVLGVMTLFSYVFNNLGIRKFGASRSAIIGATVPVLTVIFAGLIIQETLPIPQIMGVLLVTFGAAAFSLEKMRSPAKPSKTVN